MQSVSIMHFMPWLNGSVEPMVLDGATVPPPLTLLIMPILLVDSSVNQRFLSGPSVMPSGSQSGVGTGYSEMPPAGVTRAIALATPASVYQTLPSGPAVMLPGM